MPPNGKLHFPERRLHIERATQPALPSLLKIARSTKNFGDLLQRPPESRISHAERKSISCGPEKKDRISSLLVERGFHIDRAEKFFSILHHLCEEGDGRPIEADEREIWLGSSRVGSVTLFRETPVLGVWADDFFRVGFRNESSPMFEGVGFFLNNTRALAVMVDAFGVGYGTLSSAIHSSQFALFAAEKEKLRLSFHQSRSGEPIQEFSTRA